MSSNWINQQWTKLKSHHFFHTLTLFLILGRKFEPSSSINTLPYLYLGATQNTFSLPKKCTHQRRVRRPNVPKFWQQSTSSRIINSVPDHDEQCPKRASQKSINNNLTRIMIIVLFRPIFGLDILWLGSTIFDRNGCTFNFILLINIKWVLMEPSS